MGVVITTGGLPRLGENPKTTADYLGPGTYDIFDRAGYPIPQAGEEPPTASMLLAGMRDRGKAGGRGGGGGGGGGGGYPPTPKGIGAFIRSLDPTLTRKDARRVWAEWQAEQANPGLSQFVARQRNKPDPATLQAFWGQTVAPYMQQIAGQYNAGVNAGNDAMKAILGSTQLPQAERSVFEAFLPLAQAGNQQMGAALQAGAYAAPMFDAVQQQLQEAINQQQRAAYYEQIRGMQPEATTQKADAGQTLKALLG